MNMKRFLTLALAVCMLASLTLNSGAVFAVESNENTLVTEDLVVDKLDASEVDVDLTRDDLDAASNALEQQIGDDESVKVIIVMEEESIIEADSSAVLNDETQAKVEELEQMQAKVVAEIEETVLEGEVLDVSYSYTWLLNGVAAQIPYGTLADIEAVDGVKKVLLQPVYNVCETETDGTATPNTITDGVMIGRESAWANGYTGKGIKIAIIDTGLDYDHQNFQALGQDKLTANSATLETVAAALDSLNASARYSGLTAEDVYYNSKVAFGFNYCDNDLNITHDYDTMSDHGTHVAGIAAANKAEGSEVVGVAPDAQLYVMKVFGYNGGAYTQDILAALEDALKLGADVVNMSLGTPAGFTSDGDEIDEIYNRAAETGTVLSVSAGNNYTAGLTNNWGTDMNLTSNPDNAVLGSPGSYTPSLTVASVENWKIQRNYIDADGYQIGYVDSGVSYGLPLLMSLTGEYEVVAVPNVGEAADYEGLDVTGKVALVQRGVTSFVEKCENAEAAGAVACIVYNNTTGEFGMDLTDCTAKIPAAAITMADGNYLVAALEENAGLKISFPKEVGTLPSATAYQMSEFSSWGVGPDLSLEPDITAPGGNIYSTLNGGEYGLMSGTSMAAPNVAGMSALVLQYLKENAPEDTDYRELAQNLLMSTAVPLESTVEELPYSPRSQGSGLANVYNAVTSQAYLTVDGCELPKAELSDDDAKSGSYGFSFNVNNMGSTPVYYALNTMAMTEDYVDYDGIYFMSSTPKALSAAVGETSDSMVLRYDVDNNEVCWSHDAYLIYRAAIGKAENDGWKNESFRYDVNDNEAVATDDVQAYLDALVGKASNADLEEKVLMVAPGESAVVNVTVTLSDADKTYFDTYYVNGGYVEGYTCLTALNDNGVDLSLPYLGFYGDWAAAPVMDDGYYWDLYAEDYDGTQVVGNQYVNVLWTEFYGMASSFYPGLNAYLDEPFDVNNIALSPNGDGYVDTIDDMYISLLRNASALTFRYTNADSGDVYYEQTAANVSKSVYSEGYGQIIPFVYSWLETDFGLPLYDWKDQNGNDLTNNMDLLLEVEATGVADGDETEVWSVPVKIDLEAPELLSARKRLSLMTGELTLELTFRDNHSVAAVGLMSADGNEIYALEGTEDTEPDENGYQNYTVSFDITDYSGKLMLVLADYALNESYYGFNTAAEGTAYGDLVGFQYDVWEDSANWVSFDADVNMDETVVFMSDMDFVAAEYVNGFVYAQTEDGKLYGFRYEDMLKDTMDLDVTFVAQLDNVYQDLAYSYAEGKLYGLFTYEDDGYPTTEIHSINLKGEYYDPNMWSTIAPYQEDWVLGRGGVYGLTMAIDDAGTIYILGLNYDWDTESLTETAHLWNVGMEYDEWSGEYMLGYALSEVGDTGLTMDYLQSMTWDHNTEKLYWARFAPISWVEQASELIEIDPTNVTTDEEGNNLVACTKVGTLSTETCALFAPLTAESAAREEHANVPEMDSSVVGTPILRDDVITMNLGGVKALAYDFDPWYTAHKDVIWSSSDTNVVTVGEDGIITAVGAGSATITVTAKDDESKLDTVTVQVTALDLRLVGIVSAQGAGLGNVSGTGIYEFVMTAGESTMNGLNKITATEDLNYGLSLATSELGRGSLWACEYGNTGMVYEIDPETGVVKDALQPINGDMVFGMTYSESLDSFAAIMNMYLHVDQPFNHWAEEEIINSYDEETHQFTWRNINMLPYLLESNTGFVTGETGQGASSEIVFTGITSIDGGEEQYMWMDYMGGYGPEITYTPDQTLVLMDNVGRLWYIDEVTGMTAETTDWGTTYTSADGMSTISTEFHGVEAVEIVDEEGNSSYSVFVIRELAETPLTDMFREGTLPRMTYHFSDIEYAGETADGAPVFAVSLYDYWNNGTTNELYLYVPGVGTGEYEWDENWNRVEIKTPDRLFALGDTGEYNIIASIHSAEVTGGLDPETTEGAEEIAPQAVNKLAAGVYGG